MAASEHLGRLIGGLLDLGAARLAVLAITGIAVAASIGLGAAWLGRADREVLYSGLDRGDVGRIGAALTEANIEFDVNAAGDTVIVEIGEAGAARMLLAEKGLPNSAGAGYELFDELGSLGLTSFMQEVTRVRALEGEIARTLQLMAGIKAARVHLVLPDEGSFRRERQPPSASVVLRTEEGADLGAARSIRHLVAAAVPGMTLERVTILSTAGVLLAGGDGDTAAPANLISLEQSVGYEIRENVRRTLMPYLGLDNFQVSVTARLNTDKRQTSETTFDPDSRVERSTRVVRENELAENRSSEAPTTVEQNLPEEDLQPAGGDQSSTENARREELTNYELSSKTVTTVSDGYAIEKLSLAVLIDRNRLVADLGENAPPEALEEQLDRIRRLVASAAGFEEARGDLIEVTAVDFATETEELAPVEAAPWSEMLMRRSGTLINAATILAVAMIVIWFGVRPATRALVDRRDNDAAALQRLPQALEDGTTAALPGARNAAASKLDLIGDLTSKLEKSPQKRLAQMVDFDEDRVVSILRQWLHKDERVS